MISLRQTTWKCVYFVFFRQYDEDGQEVHDVAALREAENIHEMQAAGLDIDFGNELGIDGDDSEDEFELQLGEAEPGAPANLVISIGDLTNAVRRFMTTYETGNDPGEGPNHPPPEDQQNPNADGNDN